MPRTRTFVAVAPSDEVVEHAERALLRLRRLADNVKWVERQNLHWTLHFLGEVDDQQLYDICQAAERSARLLPPFVFSAAGVGAFPALDKPRTLWIGGGPGAESLEHLHATLAEQLQPLGFRGEKRKYVPHLTLGRAGRTLRPAENAAIAAELVKLEDYEAGVQAVDEVTIFGSRLRREGPEYSVLATVKLRG